MTSGPPSFSLLLQVSGNLPALLRVSVVGLFPGLLVPISVNQW